MQRCGVYDGGGVFAGGVVVQGYSVPPAGAQRHLRAPAGWEWLAPIRVGLT